MDVAYYSLILFIAPLSAIYLYAKFVYSTIENHFRNRLSVLVQVIIVVATFFWWPILYTLSAFLLLSTIEEYIPIIPLFFATLLSNIIVFIPSYFLLKTMKQKILKLNPSNIMNDNGILDDIDY